MTDFKEKNQKIFSSIASKYDRLNTILSFNKDHYWRKKAVARCAFKPDDLVLDLCCGTGKMIALECAALGQTGHVTGIDFNPEMLSVAEINLSKTFANNRYTLIEGDVLDLPFEGDTFTCITIAMGLRNVGNNINLLTEIYRVLKPGGRLICLELSKPDFPLFKPFFYLHLNYILPIIGYLGTRDHAAYEFLKASVTAFISKSDLNAILDNTGFVQTGYQSLTFGVAAIHYGIKP